MAVSLHDSRSARRGLHEESRDGPQPLTDATIARASEADVPAAALLDVAVHRLSRADPDASAARRLARWQGVALAAGGFVLAAGFAAAPGPALTLLITLATLPALAYLALRLAALREIGDGAGAGVCSRSDRDGSRSELPVYSILVPLYREAAVVPQLLAALANLVYPRDRLDILLIVEEGDAETRTAIERARPGSQVRVVVVPDGAPRTKPRALNYGLQLARGGFVVVYDAEDKPEPDQLLKALDVFARSGAELGCLQARLNVYNPDASWVTRQFTLEYTALFDGILPALERHGLPIMLGGTSNHFPRAVLDEVLGWDPFNVTEDADLGLRLARRGYRVGVLSSTTWEEAPAGFRVWLGQRTRWLKGWMQTYLVHMRRPRRLLAELGLRRFLAVNLLTGAGVLSALVHPWIYVALMADIASGKAFGSGLEPGGVLLWWLAGANLVLSYGAAIALGATAVAARGRRSLGSSGAWLPVYWLAISLAAHRALIEFVLKPHHWEKTAHTGCAPALPSWSGSGIDDRGASDMRAG